MRRILLFILPILIIVTVVMIAFGVFTIRQEERRLFDDMARRAMAVAESMELSARSALTSNDLRSIIRLVEKFQKRERLQGCVIYDKDGNIVAVTERFAEWKQRDMPYLKEVLTSKNPRRAIEKFKQYTVYSYIHPILDDDGNIIGLEEIIYDTSYVFNRLAEVWKRLSVTLIILAALIALISLIVQRHIFTDPVVRLTEWFRQFQKGEIDNDHPIREAGELGKLASEVEQVALGLRVARQSMAEEAKVRLDKEDLWTEEKLKDLVRAKLGENALFVVSNREPYIHLMDESTGSPKCVRPASGVVTAIDPILRACGGTWIAHGSGSADRKFVNSKDKLGVPPDGHRYILKRVWLTKEEEEGYYYGFANEGLWPLCHITYTRPLFRETDWQMYKKVNQKFADSVVAELPARNPFVFIQDYHYTLLAKMIKEKRPDATIALFWHIPWPNPEVFSICPYQKEILEGMLACGLIGFHVQYHCNNFLDTVNRLLEARVDTEKFSVVRAGKETLVRTFPISVADRADTPAASAGAAQAAQLRREFELDGKIVALGVERIDYTKGLTERMLAIDRFLEKNPVYRNRFVFLQLAAPSRTHIKRYHDLMSEIDEVVERVNWKHQDGDWRPIVYLRRHFSPEEIRPFYELADICIVSSLHDGMNLVAKEYVAAKADASGALILSRFTGAARELQDAIQVNPYATEEFADAIRYAIEMPSDEKRKRMEKMRGIVREYNIYRWAGSIISDLTMLRKG